MGVGGISIWQLLIILVIVVLVFGTKKLRGMGGDLGSAIKSFKKAVKEDKGGADDEASEANEGDDTSSAAGAIAQDQSGDADKTTANADSKTG